MPPVSFCTRLQTWLGRSRTRNTYSRLDTANNEGVVLRQGSFLGLAPREFHRIAYTEWGAPDNPRVVLCVHGLTRNGRDFDTLAASLAQQFRVVCPDMPGRGRSDWLQHKQDYSYPTYCAAACALLAHLRVEEVVWVGTSMGALIGMMLAALPRTPIRRLLMNDAGPFIPRAAIERLRSYVGSDPRFDSFAALLSFVREVYAPFGPLDEGQWLTLAEASARKLEGGGYALAYDPDIAQNLRAGEAADVVLWPLWDALQCPTLVLHAERSDILSVATCEEMVRRRPGTQVRHLAAVGHAPSLMQPEQVALVKEFLLYA